jgi:hypothetical protein
MRRRSELAMPCTLAVGRFVVPAQPQSTYLGISFIQSRHYRHRGHGQVTLEMTFGDLSTLLCCVGEASVRSVPRLWLVEVASRQPHQRYAASDIGTNISHADAFRARRLRAALQATDDSRTPDLVVIAVIADPNLSCSPDLPRCLLRCRATWRAGTNPDSGHKLDSSHSKRPTGYLLPLRCHGRPLLRPLHTTI